MTEFIEKPITIQSKAAKNLARSNSRMKKKLNALVNKTVTRLEGASREASVMSA